MLLQRGNAGSLSKASAAAAALYIFKGCVGNSDVDAKVCRFFDILLVTYQLTVLPCLDERNVPSSSVGRRCSCPLVHSKDG